MDYPIWELNRAGGGFLIALIATIHVYVAHFAIGGGLFLVLTEKKGYKEQSPFIIDFVKFHAKWFMMISMVLGGLTGVGIWFCISLLSPNATSILVHHFVFAWASEWVCFTGEIVALIIYYKRFDHMEPSAHQKIGWFYCIFAWLSLFFVNGIITFMLTPGQWIYTGNFWHGFFNPSFMPSLLFRTDLALMIAGIFALITAVYIPDKHERDYLIHYCAKWLIIPLIALPIFAHFYFHSLPVETKWLIQTGSPEIFPFVQIMIGLTPILLIIGLIMILKTSDDIKKVLAWGVLIFGFLYIGSFEWIREASRRPYLISEYLYSNGIKKQRLADLNQTGILQSAKWVTHKTITDNNQLEAGKDIFRIECSACHSIGGIMNDIKPLTQKYSLYGMDAFLSGMGGLNTYMPPFIGTKDERMALSQYIVGGLHHKSNGQTRIDIKEWPLEMPLFNSQSDDFILLSWSQRGMQMISDCSAQFVIQPPGNDIFTQMIRRGKIPELIIDDFAITYEIETGFEKPSQFIDFWRYAIILYGKRIHENVGLSQLGLSGQMAFKNETIAFTAEQIPVIPYHSQKGYNPYPLININAMAKESKKKVASTRLVSSVSTEMGCKTCHGGSWSFNDQAGIEKQTAIDILTVHDRKNQTDLLVSARKQQPIMCRSCHDESSQTHLNLSTAIHGVHALYLSNRGSDACLQCHPGQSSCPSGALRGVHMQIGLNCTTCHGHMEDHAISLLKNELQQNKHHASRLIPLIVPKAYSDSEKIIPRRPWDQEPDCLTCHKDFDTPDMPVSAFNQWTEGKDYLYQNRTDEVGIHCAACHGVAHAIYPTVNSYGENRDNIQPMQYQKISECIGSYNNCSVCHTVEMDNSVHHPNMK